MIETPLGELDETRLDNGLRVGVLRCPHAPIVTSVLWYRVGTVDESGAEGGAAHFLEHMMFKGSPRFGRGQVDRLTQALGGSNNAFTSYDATAYYFELAADRWTRALEMEADRMGGLLLEPDEVDHERNVICEEIAMYESDPWDALEMRVQALVFGDHPYARPVLGTPSSLAAIGRDELAAFHRRFYCPANAVLVVAGDVGEAALDSIRESFASIPPGTPNERPARVAAAGPAERCLRHHGEVARLLWSRTAPAWGAPDHPHLRLLLQALTEGRSSRLHRILVEEEQLCSWVAGELHPFLEGGRLSFALEVAPGVEPARVEERFCALLEEVVRDGLSETEASRARRTYEADWVFGHERIHQRAVTLASAMASYDAEFAFRYLKAVLHATPADVASASAFLRPDEGVLGWSLPEDAC